MMLLSGVSRDFWNTGTESSVWKATDGEQKLHIQLFLDWKFCHARALLLVNISSSLCVPSDPSDYEKFLLWVQLTIHQCRFVFAFFVFKNIRTNQLQFARLGTLRLHATCSSLLACCTVYDTTEQRLILKNIKSHACTFMVIKSYEEGTNYKGRSNIFSCR